MDGIQQHSYLPQNSVILKRVFEKLNLKDLKECRLVCKTWHSATADAMRSCCRVELTQRLSISQKCFSWMHFLPKNCFSQRPHNTQRFLNLIKSKTSTFLQEPFADTFEIRNGEINAPEFWTLCGPTIKSLVLRRVTFQSTDAVRHAIFHSCPNLEKLVVAGDLKVRGPNKPADPVWVEPKIQNRNLKTLELQMVFSLEWDLSWVEIFNHFPSLQNLNLDLVHGGSELVFKSLAIARKHDAACCNLKKISFRFDPEEEAVEVERVLVDANLALEDLEMMSLYTRGTKRTAWKILSTHVATLRRLCIGDKLTFGRDLFPDEIIFENLEELRLSMCLSSASMSFLGLVPNLNKLHMSVSRICLVPNLDLVALESCTEFVLDHVRCLRVEDVEMLGKCLPNVEKLEIENLDNETFAKVCECWPNLRSLKMSRCKVDDCGISGLDEEDVEEINSKGDEGIWRPITVPRPNLAALKC